MRTNITGAIILIIVGSLLLADNLIPNFRLGHVLHQWWPLALIVLGISLLFRK